MSADFDACSRRQFLTASAGLMLSAGLPLSTSAGEGMEPIIDIHQHTNYAGRTDEQLIAHQRAMGVTKTILLPAGRFYGLDARCGGNESVQSLTRAHPEQFLCFANEVADIQEAPDVVRQYLRRGAVGLGEQKFRVACDGIWFARLVRVAEEFRVPILMHFQHGVYNLGIENFRTVLRKHPTVNFIGHAQTWWGNVDARHQQAILYPTGKVTPGGITDHLLRDYPNIFGDMSAGSGLNHLVRDPEQAAAFLQRHQDKLLFGSDCDDLIGRGPGCQGAQIVANIRKLACSKVVERKILFENAKRLFRL